jgi:hypothetical protein
MQIREIMSTRLVSIGPRDAASVDIANKYFGAVRRERRQISRPMPAAPAVTKTRCCIDDPFFLPGPLARYG